MYTVLWQIEFNLILLFTGIGFFWIIMAVQSHCNDRVTVCTPINQSAFGFDVWYAVILSHMPEVQWATK